MWTEIFTMSTDQNGFDLDPQTTSSEERLPELSGASPQWDQHGQGAQTCPPPHTHRLKRDCNKATLIFSHQTFSQMFNGLLGRTSAMLSLAAVKLDRTE